LKGFKSLRFTRLERTFDATSKTCSTVWFEFKLGTTETEAGLSNKLLTSLSDGLNYTFHLRKGVKFHSTKDFKNRHVILTLTMSFSV